MTLGPAAAAGAPVRHTRRGRLGPHTQGREPAARCASGGHGRGGGRCGPCAAYGRSWRGSTAQWTAVHAAREMRGHGALDAARGGARAPPESGGHCGSIHARTRVSPPSWGKRPGACGSSTSPAVSRKQGEAGHGNRARGHHPWLHPLACPDPCFPPKRPDGKHAQSIWVKHAQGVSVTRGRGACRQNSRGRCAGAGPRRCFAPSALVRAATGV